MISPPHDGGGGGGRKKKNSLASPADAAALAAALLAAGGDVEAAGVVSSPRAPATAGRKGGGVRGAGCVGHRARAAAPGRAARLAASRETSGLAGGGARGRRGPTDDRLPPLPSPARSRPCSPFSAEVSARPRRWDEEVEQGAAQPTPLPLSPSASAASADSAASDHPPLRHRFPTPAVATLTTDAVTFARPRRGGGGCACAGRRGRLPPPIPFCEILGADVVPDRVCCIATVRVREGGGA